MSYSGECHSLRKPVKVSSPSKLISEIWENLPMEDQSMLPYSLKNSSKMVFNGHISISQEVAKEKEMEINPEIHSNS